MANKNSASNDTTAKTPSCYMREVIFFRNYDHPRTCPVCKEYFKALGQRLNNAPIIDWDLEQSNA